MPNPTPLSTARVQELLQREQRQFDALHPQSLRLAARSAAHFLFGVPLHWMRDWPQPSALFMREARGARLVCADGLEYADFCLGDTGAMFGHSPPCIADALARQGARGLTAMLPSALAPEVGEMLADVFGLPMWQLALSASDANRFALRWARAVTGRPVLLVFDGCYHGAVDDTVVDLMGGRAVRRPSLLGQAHDNARFTRVVPFNDLAALERALADGQVACLLAEPALTNCGLVPPDEGFWPQAQALCRRQGTLLILDETHTLSTARGGYAKAHGLAPDMLVMGKAIAGGLPCGVYGFTAELAERMREAKNAAPEGHSGIGTTLAGNALQIAALDAALRALHTEASYRTMQLHADALAAGLRERIARHRLRWTVTQLGARMELQFAAHTPRNASEVRAMSDEPLAQLLHLYQLNRGVLLTPFHNMMLVSPATTAADCDKLLGNFDAFAAELNA